MQFRRTYSSNSIKVRDVEVGPQSFDKIKLIGKGDVGKVYLVREKKSTRLYAMKGRLLIFGWISKTNHS
jgi:protein-serine/threonine kinase